jgi:NodT family efflux transporter outer membrane factor (OMF) lipoprotein
LPHTAPTAVAIPASFKEAPGWRVAVPSDEVARGQWWLLFNDPVLSGLEEKVSVSNQTVAASRAAYEQARALVSVQRAALFPTLSASGSAADSGASSSSGTGGATSSSKYGLSIGATWEPDLWGKLGNSVTQAGALAQASAGDLLNATLSARGELALNYVQLRGIDAQKSLLDATIAGYTQALAITRNRYNAGVAATSDVLQAQTALSNAQGDRADLDRQRALLEHAIAVLVGENPSSFVLASQPWQPVIPAIPSTLPAALLERRADVAAAERRVAAANANIGIQRAAYFPTLSLSGDAGQNAASLGKLFDASSSVWSLGMTGLFTLLDFGAHAGQVAEVKAQFEQASTNYRQSVLTAVQQTEDNLVATRVLAEVSSDRSAASAAADKAEQIAQNQYKAGLIGYADAIVAQTAAYNARNANVQAIISQQSAAIALIQAIGGSWEG